MNQGISWMQLIKAYSVLGSQRKVSEAYGLHPDTVRNIFRKFKEREGMSDEEFTRFVRYQEVNETMRNRLLSSKKSKPTPGCVVDCDGTECVCVEILDDISIVAAPIKGNRPLWRARRFVQKFKLAKTDRTFPVPESLLTQYSVRA